MVKVGPLYPTGRPRYEPHLEFPTHTISTEPAHPSNSRHLDSPHASLQLTSSWPEHTNNARHLDRSDEQLHRPSRVERPLYCVVAVALAVVLAVAVAVVLALAVAVASGYAKASALALSPLAENRGFSPWGMPSSQSSAARVFRHLT